MTTTTTHRMSPKLEDAEFMADTGESLAGALARLGYKNHNAFHTLCLRHDRLDIYARLSGRNQL